MATKLLRLIAVGNPPPQLLKELTEPLKAQLDLGTAVDKDALPTPAYAFNKDRNQYHCNAIMRRLVTMLEPPQTCVLGVTDVDVFVPDSPFVFGEADRESRAALVSTFRF